MRQTTGTRRSASEKIVKDIKRATRKQYSSEEKIRIVLDGLRGEDSIAELCRREGISQGVYAIRSNRNERPLPALRDGAGSQAHPISRLQRKVTLSAHQPFGRRISDFISQRRLTGNWEHNSRLQQSSPARPSVQNAATVGLVTKGSEPPFAAKCPNVCLRSGCVEQYLANALTRTFLRPVFETIAVFCHGFRVTRW